MSSPTETEGGATNCPLGSRQFYKALSAAVPGVEVERITRTHPGHIHISLISDADTDAALESLRHKYLDACTQEEIIGTEVTISIRRRCPDH